MQGNSELSNKRLVLLALYELGGAERAIDTEDLAMKIAGLAPGRFTWKKYPEQIDLEAIRLVAKDMLRADPQLVSGGMRNGWMLTPAGMEWCKREIGPNGAQPVEQAPSGQQAVLMATEAYQKFSNNRQDEITIHDARRFLRVDEYTSVRRRKERIQAVSNTAAGNDKLCALIEHLRSGFPEVWT